MIDHITKSKKFAAVLVMAASLVVTQIAYASLPGPVPYMAGVVGSGIAQNTNLAKFTATGSGPIPAAPDAFIGSNIAVGYTWANAATGKALVVAIHPTFIDTLTQGKTGWHMHTVTLAAGATAPNDFCVVSIDSSPTAGIDIVGSTMKVNISLLKLPAGETPLTLSTIAGFSLQADPLCASGLAVLTYT